MKHVEFLCAHCRRVVGEARGEWDEGAVASDELVMLCRACQDCIEERGYRDHLRLFREIVERFERVVAAKWFAPPREAPPLYVCPRCGAKSWNPNDAKHRYCGRCHRFAEDPG